MKKYLIIIFVAAMLNSCKEEVNLDALSFPPSILSMNPGENSNVPKGSFTVKVVLVDGVGSPLSSASLKMTDASGAEIFSVEKAVSGTKDSIIVEGSTFNAVGLAPGSYKLMLEAKDVKGLITTKEAPFKIVNSLYVSVETKMFIAGEFNGWGADALQLVADNTWEIKNLDLKGGRWKFKNTVDWTDKDWGDANCDGVMAIASNGGPDTNCAFSGLSNIRFNDKTLAYTVIPAVNYAKNVNALYLLGSVNNFDGSNYKFKITGNHTWQLDEIRLKPGDAFKLSEGPHFELKSFGASDVEGKAMLFGSNIIVPATKVDAFYKILFNDETLLYSLELVRNLFPEKLYLVGASTAADWNENNALPFYKVADGKFEIYSYLTVAGGFKFLEAKSYTNDWGVDPNASGKIIQSGESNATVTADGFYRVFIDFGNHTYTVQLIKWGLIGDATGSWDVDKDMTGPTTKSDFTWTITTNLVAGGVKFRANDEWQIDLGDTGADGSLNSGGSNINITLAGNYTIKLILTPTGNQFTYTVTKN